MAAAPGARAVRRGPFGRIRENLADSRDPIFVGLGASGELLAARVRILLLCVLLAIQLVPGTAADIRLVTLPLNVVALIVAFLFYRVASRRPRPWLEGSASSAADVTLVSCGLAAFLLLDQPHTAVNSGTLFELYFLAIGCASLRYNPQACALTGLLAVAQYGAIVVYAAARWNLNDARYAPFKLGMFDWSTQGMRLILMAGAALVSALIVLRAKNLHHLSTTDLLSGAASRRAFDERLEAEASRARRNGRPFTLALIDVDNFKQVNDTRGHATGDAVLRAVAAIFVRSLRPSDMVARFGGDEFALLLPETSAELVMDRLERLRAEVAASRIRPSGDRSGKPVQVTLSIGAASWPDDGPLVPLVLAAADARLYEAKRRGRNRLVGPAPHEELREPSPRDAPDPLPLSR
ncbi:MAG: GGDEF domain-containing protein [Candidatus Rokubacteria bacterium]|nr:GGDEF domain-containing protein [Candidatus Rokubacteria bacterium]